ncbi:hypothetical protein EJ08DRAFT_697452 [Tothia fuscella]|uniref:Uncharacterized protein n=1 Tax=Tothia fuscella TaxID=1048955 RepID=A0A9P4NSI1_9PEZI|nr:hypothetical protein EJ08DRAFT_697452 [Tothia fuscella]
MVTCVLKPTHSADISLSEAHLQSCTSKSYFDLDFKLNVSKTSMFKLKFSRTTTSSASKASSSRNEETDNSPCHQVSTPVDYQNPKRKSAAAPRASEDLDEFLEGHGVSAIATNASYTALSMSSSSYADVGESSSSSSWTDDLAAGCGGEDEDFRSLRTVSPRPLESDSEDEEERQVQKKCKKSRKLRKFMSWRTRTTPVEDVKAKKR